MQEWETLGGRCKWVRLNRLERRLESQRALSGHMDGRGLAASHSTIGRYERNEESPRLDYLDELARLGRVRLAWLVTGEGSPERAPEPDRAERALRVIGRVAEWARQPAGEPTPPESWDRELARLLVDSPAQEQTGES